MNSNRIRTGIATKLLVVLCVTALVGCSGHTGKQAGRGATVGAVAGGVGGLVSALVFGGDPVDYAARGAVWGVAGAMGGAQMDKAEKAKVEAQSEAQIQQLKVDIGEDAFNGLAALAECKHDVAIAYGRTAAKSGNKNHALAGLWMEVLAYGDRGEEDKAHALFPDLVAKDAEIKSEAQAEETMQKALQKLMDIRQEYKLPRTCG
ncbi:MAG: hypothetical protein JRF18_02625 [Deltaproteobacteria bacterium]|nr:hypothetical protein [Deltaproteobacteria bacterium]